MAYLFLENLSSLFSYKNFHQFFMIIFWPDLCFTRFQASVRLGALFGVSILEARNELWYVMYQMSGVICNFLLCVLRLSTFRWRKARGKEWFSSYFVLDKWLRILPKAYLISGMKYYCLYHIIITSIDPIISFILLLLWQLKFEFARARIHTF